VNENSKNNYYLLASSNRFSQIAVEENNNLIPQKQSWFDEDHRAHWEIKLLK